MQRNWSVGEVVENINYDSMECILECDSVKIAFSVFMKSQKSFDFKYFIYVYSDFTIYFYLIGLKLQESKHPLIDSFQ